MSEITHCAKCGKVFETLITKTVSTSWGEDFCSVRCFTEYKGQPAKVKES